MKRRTGLESTRVWMRDWVGSSEERERDVGVRAMWCGMGANAADGERRAARKMNERCMVKNHRLVEDVVNNR